MPTTSSFVSYAQNGEDVVLWRALQNVVTGRYVEVGANHPTTDSTTRAFYDRGWRGMTIEPLPALVALHRDQRPEDLQIEGVASRSSSSVTLHEIEGTGLSTTVDAVSRMHTESGWQPRDVLVPARSLDDLLEGAGWTGEPIHFMTIDVEGAERDVLLSIDLRTWRPWVLVVEATVPLTSTPSHESWEKIVLDAGYTFCQFDGLSRYYVADEKVTDLKAALSYPACVLDEYVSAQTAALADELAAARAELAHVEAVQEGAGAREKDLAEQLELMTNDAIRWRAAALNRWSEAAADSSSQVNHLQHMVNHLQAEIEATHQTLSWRVTTPLRAVRSRGGIPAERND